MACSTIPAYQPPAPSLSPLPTVISGTECYKGHIIYYPGYAPQAAINDFSPGYIIQNPYYTVLILGSWWANLSLTFLKGVIDNVGQGGQC